jgi:hypothetical protein
MTGRPAVVAFDVIGTRATLEVAGQAGRSAVLTRPACGPARQPLVLGDRRL